MGNCRINKVSARVMRVEMDHKRRTADQLIEDGVGLIARGMFRMGATGEQNNPQKAYNAGMAAISTIREMAFEFLRKTKSDA